MKFKKGDEVVVVEESRYVDQIGLKGIITKIDSNSPYGLPIEIKYSTGNSFYEVGERNTYAERDLELTELSKSPLWKALS